MKKEDVFKLTNNEKNILIELASNARTADTKISEKLNISQQAVHQIRSRLEDLGIIKGYIPVIDFKKIGLSILYFTGIEILPPLWDKLTEEQLNEKIKSLPFLFQLFRVPTADISYIAIFGFKNMSEQEAYSRKIEKHLAKDMQLRWSYVASIDNILSYTDLNLISHALSDNEVDMLKIIREISK